MMQWSYDTLLKWGTDELTAHSVDNASVDAWYLLEHIYGISRVDFLIRRNDPFDEAQMKKSADYQALIRRRSEGYPVQYLTGGTEFMGLPFFVNESVLIPRQDTEVLVETALAMMKPECRLLDMCTGSGCILLSLAKLGTVAEGVGVDISEGALKVAERNRENLGLPQVRLVHSNLFESVEGVFDMIVSNPPYIPTEDIEDLMREVRDHEPHLALDGSKDGLLFYRKLAEESGRYLVPGGSLLFEIGYDQGGAVSQLLDQAGFKDIHVKKDLAGLDRVVYAVKAAKDGGK